MTYIESEFYHVAPLSLENYAQFAFNLVISNNETGAKTKHLRITPEQFKLIEQILIEK
jgi:hypothetical protein